MRKNKLYISDGNIRMKIPTFSLPSGITCSGKTKHCEKNCYAKKAERLYKNCLASRVMNLNGTLSPHFVTKMIDILKRKKGKYVRVHESGDFYSQTYLDRWIKIAEKMKDKMFLIFTQAYHLDFSKVPDNFILYYSIWDDSKNVPKDGLKAYVKDNGSGKIGKYNIPKGIKECTKGKGSDLTCDQCLWCYEGKGDITFKLH